MSSAQGHNADTPPFTYPRFRSPFPANVYATNGVQALEHQDEIGFTEPLAPPAQWGEHPKGVNTFSSSR
ncbi:MAG TPA: hypothetical protein VGO47_01930 [Chlamydiales bacterium]|nr:hypothetical protein [Chlamydiales bacterium]